MSQPVNMLKAFATTSPGLEGVLRDELRALGVAEVRPGRAGCGFACDRVGLERAVLALRTAHRVLWTLGEVDAHDAEALYRGVRGLVRWQGLVPPDKTFAIDATCRDTPAFRDARFVALKVKDAIADAVRDAVGQRPSVSIDDPDVLVRVSVARGRGIVSLDAAGKVSLHARGYRTDKGEAALRESLAAALSMLAGWDDAGALVDPMCGSGTILIEAALRARGVVPGALRGGHGFTRWPGFKAARHQALMEAFVKGSRERIVSPVLGFDLDAEVIAIAEANATRAGVRGDVVFATGDARTVSAVPAGGWLVTNPPWGARLGDQATTVALLRAVAAHWRALGTWRAAVLVPDLEAARALALKDERTLPVEAGGKEVLVVTGRL